MVLCIRASNFARNQANNFGEPFLQPLKHELYPTFHLTDGCSINTHSISQEVPRVFFFVGSVSRPIEESLLLSKDSVRNRCRQSSFPLSICEKLNCCRQSRFHSLSVRIRCRQSRFHSVSVRNWIAVVSPDFTQYLWGIESLSSVQISLSIYEDSLSSVQISLSICEDSLSSVQISIQYRWGVCDGSDKEEEISSSVALHSSESNTVQVLLYNVRWSEPNSEDSLSLYETSLRY